MIEDIFYSNKYDDRIALVDGDKSYSFKDLKELIAAQTEFIKSKSENIVIPGDDNFNFIIQFFASIFADKNVYLITDKKVLQNFDKDYYIADELCHKSKSNYEFAKLDIYKPRVYLYTSGSTGEPKAIAKNIHNLVLEAEEVINEFELKNKNYTVISTTTMSHMFGLTMYFMVPFCAGLKINIQRVYYPDGLETENSIFVTSPTFLKTISKHNLSFTKSPKYVISAGGKLSEEVFEYFENKLNIIDIYGSSETGIIAFRTSKKLLFKTFKNVKIKAEEDSVRITSSFCYGGNCVINDKIEVEKDGFLIKSRTDRLMKIYDKRVSAPALEDRLKDNSFVNDCYVFKNGDKPVCLCALSELGKEYLIENGTVGLTKNLKNFMNDFFEIVPQRWKYIDEIPKKITGKINKHIIEKIFDINVSLPVILDRKIIENGIIYKIFFHKNCNFFNGHFPQYPIVPGVVQLYLAKELANVHFNLELGQGQWKRVKFANIIEQDSIVYLKLEYNLKNVTYEYYFDDKKYSSGTFLCENVFKELQKS